MNTIPRAVFTAAGDVALRFPYNGRLVELLKRKIPSYARQYAPDDKTWTVAAPYAEFAVDLLRRHFPDPRIERPGTRPDLHPSSAARPFAVLHLLPSAPPDLIEGAYRILARLHHPDVGGDPEAMRALNEARDALKVLVAG
jgi:hypothetical protein